MLIWFNFTLRFPHSSSLGSSNRKSFMSQPHPFHNQGMSTFLQRGLITLSISSMRTRSGMRICLEAVGKLEIVVLCFRLLIIHLFNEGVETIAHIRENGRLTIMFCAFEGPPRIVRLWGKGIVHEFDTAEYNALIPLEKRKVGSRSVIMQEVERVSTVSWPTFHLKSISRKQLTVTLIYSHAGIPFRFTHSKPTE